MEVTGFAIGAASVASIFQTCVHGYRTLDTAMKLGNTILTLNIQFRIEGLRLLMWGRYWGLIEEISSTKGEVKTLIDEGDENNSSTSESEVAKPGKRITLLDSVDEDHEIPGLRDLTIEILGRIHEALEEWKSTGQKYGVLTVDSQTGTDPQSSLGKKKRSLRLIMSIPSKLRWAIKDKTALDDLLSKLTNLNDSLEKLLPRRDRNSLVRGLTGEIVGAIEGDKSDCSSDSTLVDDEFEHLEGHDDVKAAKIIRLRRANKTQIEEKPKARTPSNDQPNPFSKQSVWAGSEQGSMHIPTEDFVRFVEPKLLYYHVNKEIYVPLPRMLIVYAPISKKSTPSTACSGSEDGVGSREEAAKPAITEESAQAVLIEWRPAAAETNRSKLSPQDLLLRRDHIAHLLHRTYSTDADFRILDCIGYTTTSGHTPDGGSYELVGYVYRYPEFASTDSLPVSLRELLGEAYASNNPKVPSLNHRFRLAYSLAISLYQLQCAGWVHRKLSSYNVIFFRDRVTGEVDLSRPYLMGWQYSRPDDERHSSPSEDSQLGIADLDMYVHIARLIHRRDQGHFPRFRKSFDIYSFGVILLEIAFWEPVMALATSEQKVMINSWETFNHKPGPAPLWWKAVWNTAEAELAPEMGDAYRDAVLFCLRGSGEERDIWTTSNDDHRLERRVREKYSSKDFSEVGIEKDFYWRVVKILDRVRM